MRLNGKVAMITGAGSGMGQAEALLFSREGAKVIVNDINDENGMKTVAQIRSAGGEAGYFHADVSSASEVEKMVAFTRKEYGKLNVLVNNAGISAIGKGDGKVADVLEEIWDKVVDVDLKGAFLCCKYAIPLMLESGGGSIVNISSIAAIKAAGSGAYSAAKGGVISLTRSIAMQYVRQNIRVNAVCPGRTETGMLNTIGSNSEGKQKLLGLVPMGRFASPMEIAYPVLFLASDEASFITGATLVVGGGDGL